jgi:cytosine/adenosine deaminase-related metal-dependent hydrolase
VKSRAHKAKWVMTQPGAWIENGFVEITDGRVSAVDKANSETAGEDRGAGVILPALVNTHTHLSLSRLADLAGLRLPFIDWVKTLISVRASLSEEEMLSASVAAAQAAKNTGTGLVGEVGTGNAGLMSITEAGLEGMVFEELLGAGPQTPSLPEDSDTVRFSYAGHALHTTSPKLLKALKSLTSDRASVFSLHLAESEIETEFLCGGGGPWADLLDSRGIDYSDWDLADETPVERAQRLGLLGPGTLVVHVLQADRSDFETLAQTGTSVCVSPRSNMILHRRLPDIGAMLAAGISPALGTDSLASNSTLNMFDEMAFVAENYMDLSPETILAMAGAYGGKALGRPDAGRIKVGDRARLIYVDVDADSAEEAALQLVATKPERVDWL